jgi:hypothetical protein
MSAYEVARNSRSVVFSSDDNTDRRSRASQITALKRKFERDNSCRLMLRNMSYSETHGFLSRSTATYDTY